MHIFKGAYIKAESFPSPFLSKMSFVVQTKCGEGDEPSTDD